MSMAVRPGYVNPLTTMGQKKNALTAASPLTQQKSETKDDVQDLQTRQQALQNNILLLKSTSDGASGTAETQEVLQEQLEEIAAELKTAKAQEIQAAAPQTAAPQVVKEKFDRFEKASEQTDSPGLYQIQKDGEESYKVIFSPYMEEK